MIGIDTNILVRLLTNDDKEQTRYAINLFQTNAIFIAKSVLLETEWVLRYTYNIEAKNILIAFENLLGLPEVTVEDHECMEKALQWYSHSLDFADALHLASCQAKKFATLDKAFIKKAKKLNIEILTINK